MPFDPNDPDTKAALEAAIAKATDPLNDKVEELTNKYTGAMDDLKKAQRDLRAKSEITPDDVRKLEEQIDTLKGELDAATKDVKTLTTERDKAVKTLESESAYTSKLLIQDGLKSALIAAGVKDEDFLDTLTAKFSSSAQVVTKGEERTAMIGDKSLSDHITEWAGSDAGKKFVAAPANGGGGANGGGNGGGGNKTLSRSTFDALPAGEKLAFAKDGGRVIDNAA